MKEEIISAPMHKLSVEDIASLASISDVVFEPLIRPFRQRRIEPKFSFRRTIASAIRTGDFLPSYEDDIRRTRNSKLVIAMSLSGIDRCSAVALLPLLREMRKHLAFRLYIYTNDLIEAQFDADGFLENDIDISWNNVLFSTAMHRIINLELSREETTLLLIDNMGGGDSEWFLDSNEERENEIANTQASYLLRTGKESFYSKMREELAGDYSKIESSKYRETWEKIVERNTRQRWVETPAMKDYLARWIFHPQFGRVYHGNHLRIPSYWALKPKFREKFREIHHMSTIATEEGESKRNMMIREGVLDYVHHAETIGQFAEVVSNIAHRRCTNKVSPAQVTFLSYIEEVEFSPKEGGDHSESIVGKEECFSKIPKFQGDPLPSWKSLHLFGSKKPLPISALAPSEIRECVTGYVSQAKYTQGMSQYSKLQWATSLLNYLKNYKLSIHQGEDRIPEIITQYRSERLSCKPEFVGCNKLEPFLDEYTKLWSNDYQPFLNELPLKHVIWCSGSSFSHNHMSYSIEAGNPDAREECVYHEQGHYMEHVCPFIGSFTNELIHRLTRETIPPRSTKPVEKTTRVIKTVLSQPWITDYAGKYYGKHHKDLPAHTEIISVYGEYFRSPESLVELAEYDKFMVEFMCFIFMGGPICYARRKELKAKRDEEVKILEKTAKSSPPDKSAKYEECTIKAEPKPKSKKFGL